MPPIDQHRKKMRLLHASEQAAVLSRQTTTSPCGNYCLELVELTHDEVGSTSYYWVVVKRAETCAPVVDFFTDTNDEYFGWLTSLGRDYLLFAELEGGQTVVDLQHGILVSFYDPDDEFIWTDFHLSPSGLRLAVEGCFWACFWEIRVYDFSRPVGNPLPILRHYDSTGTHLSFDAWVDENRFAASDERGQHTFEILASLG